MQEQLFERIQIVPAERPDGLLTLLSARQLYLSNDSKTEIAVRDYRNAIARPARATPNQHISDKQAASLPNPEPCIAFDAIALL